MDNNLVPRHRHTGNTVDLQTLLGPVAHAADHGEEGAWQVKGGGAEGEWTASHPLVLLEQPNYSLSLCERVSHLHIVVRHRVHHGGGYACMTNGYVL